MRVLLVNKYWYPRGGSERVLFATKDALEKAGHTTFAFGMEHPDNIVAPGFFLPEIDYRKTHGLSAVWLGMRSIYNREAKKAFLRVIDEFKPDLIHFHNIYHQLSFSLVVAAKLRGIPTVMTLHDYKLISPNYTLFHHGQVSEESVGGAYYKTFLNNAMESWPKSFFATIEAYLRRWRGWSQKIDHCISPSLFLKNKFVSVGYKPESITVLRNPIDANAYVPRYDDDGYVVYAGRFSNEKGIETLLLAAAKTPEIQYRLVGGGPLFGRVRAHIIARELDNVSCVGWQHGEKLKDVIADARLVVVPSVWYENYPQSVLEAKALGKVVVASDIGGVPELLPPECLVPPGDPDALSAKIREWYQAPSSARARTGEKFRQEVERENNLTRYTKELLTVYALVTQTHS